MHHGINEFKDFVINHNMFLLTDMKVSHMWAEPFGKKKIPLKFLNSHLTPSVSIFICKLSYAW
jgi:hypothetical protein